MKCLVFILALAAIACGFQSTKETRIKIAVIDTGVNYTHLSRAYFCRDGQFDMTGRGMKDVRPHGTNVAGIITKYINHKTHCITMIKFFHTSATMNDLLRAMRLAEAIRPAYLNLSIHGDGYSSDEQQILNRMAKRGTVIVVAAGNERNYLDFRASCATYPACYKLDGDMHVVGSVDTHGVLGSMSSYGPRVTDWEVGVEVEGGGLILSGTSMATAVLTGKLAGGYYESSINRRLKPVHGIPNRRSIP